MSIVKLKVCENGDVGTGFCTRWNGRLVIATCDHLFLGLSYPDRFVADLEIGGVQVNVEVRRHASADVAILLYEHGDPLRRLASTSSAVIGTRAAIAKGFPAASANIATITGSTRDQVVNTRLCRHPGGDNKTYSGLYIPNSFAGIPGMSGGPVVDVETGGTLGLYSSGFGNMLIDAVHAGHISEIQ